MKHTSQEITVIFNADTVKEIFFYSAEMNGDSVKAAVTAHGVLLF